MYENIRIQKKHEYLTAHVISSRIVPGLYQDTLLCQQPRKQNKVRGTQVCYLLVL